MRLTLDTLPLFVDLAHHGKTPEARAEALDKLKDDVAQGRRRLEDTLILQPAPGGPLQACIRLAPGEAGRYILSRPGLAPELQGPDADRGAAEEALRLLLTEATELASLRGIPGLSTRVHIPPPTPGYRELLLGLGFTEVGSRIEFKQEVDLLPDEEGSPLTDWRDLDEVGLQTAASVFARAASGALDWDEDKDDPLQLIPEYLQDPELTGTPDCVQVGYLDGEPVAFVVAQVDPTDGWARITWMGLCPEARGKGLGSWVHRRGFAMLRAQGGRLYHGGTHMDNAPMRRLFERHSCPEYARMIEMAWSAPKG